MPIKKRLTTKQRLHKQLPEGWKDALSHPMMKKLTHSKEFRPSAKNVVHSIKQVKGWKGASWREKVFVLAFDLIMEKAGYESILDVDAYNRLQDHLINNEHKMYSDFTSWMVFVWDIYHDHYRLQELEAGALNLDSKPVNRKPRKIKLKRSIK